MMSIASPTNSDQPQIASDQALQIARMDAEQAYRDLTRYRICTTLEADGWHIDYELKDADLNGGGPHYVIEPVGGAIIARRYEQ
jgi:hypothetical protein